MKNKKIKIFLTIFFAGILLCLGLAVYSQIYNTKNQKDIEFQSFGKGIFVVSIDSYYFLKNSDVIVPDALETVLEVSQKNNAKVAINTGFFDPNNGKTTSYILKNNKIIADPQDNERLIGSEELKPHMDKIFNRSEFRLYSCPIDEIMPNGELRAERPCIQITNHNTPLIPASSCQLVYSIQAGPELVPELKLEEEFFVLKKDGKIIRESAGVLHKYARSAIGFTKDRILLVAASNENPMTLEELADFMKKIGVQRAMAFDGGSSTSLYLNKLLIGMESDKPTFNLTSAKDNAARRVKSVLIVR